METVFIENPKEYFDEIESLISVVFEGFMALPCTRITSKRNTNFSPKRK